MLVMTAWYFKAAGWVAMLLIAAGRQTLLQRTVPGSDFETCDMDADGHHIQRLTTVQMFLQSPAWRS